MRTAAGGAKRLHALPKGGGIEPLVAAAEGAAQQQPVAPGWLGAIVVSGGALSCWLRLRRAVARCISSVGCVRAELRWRWRSREPARVKAVFTEQPKRVVEQLWIAPAAAAAVLALQEDPRDPARPRAIVSFGRTLPRWLVWRGPWVGRFADAHAAAVGVDGAALRAVRFRLALWVMRPLAALGTEECAVLGAQRVEQRVRRRGCVKRHVLDV